MAALNLDDLFNKMVGAATTSLSGKWPAISALATTSLKTLAQNLVNVQELLLAESISQAQATLMIDMQKNSLQTVLLSEEGLGLIAAQDAINAVIGVVKDAVNVAIGFALL
ncbi:hypothetical protein HDF24_07365 [Mucilaginibacter sp. X4EP1]|uniref:hypothetical protein n=1 Tax=Mucilaginibacter sp. X4EP1 TaxID=2723092 RepID=UPI0021677C55|nr:hypothetical protein [Mucilaginibacter sp. X4EP1]MCS3814129.1 hypothetical protein [Mucilaginibacter sp. X4EP1]